MALGLASVQRYALLAAVALGGVAYADDSMDRLASGTARLDATLAAGTIAVRVGYEADQPHAWKPAPGLAVSLVGYASSGKVSLVAKKTDAAGRATFRDLDRTGSTAYFALAEVTRDKRVDRLESAPAILASTGGVQMTLLAGKDATVIDELDKLATQATAARVKGKLRVTALVAASLDEPVAVIDAATGKVLTTASLAKAAPGPLVDLPELGRPGQVLFVETHVRGRHFRSPPFQLVPDRATVATIFVMPVIIVTMHVTGVVTAAGLDATVKFVVNNNSWEPVGPFELPLPAGFAHATLDGLGPADAIAKPGIQLGRPLAPGSTSLVVSFELPARGQIAWHQELPHGSWQSAIEILDEPGVVLSAPGKTIDRRDGGGGVIYQHVADLTMRPGQSLELAIAMPKLDPKVEALARPCAALHPQRTFALKDKPMPDASVKLVDGTTHKLSEFRNHQVLLVNFMASWDSLSRTELPTLANVAAAASVVLVASDWNANDVRTLVGHGPSYPTVLDGPVGGANIGPLTTAWGTSQLPESYLVDRRGVVRMYFDNTRDWSTPEALACVKALAAD